MERVMSGITLKDRNQNSWIRAKTRVKDVIYYAAKLKWKWAGHKERYRDERRKKAIQSWRPCHGKWGRGRPQMKWEYNRTDVATNCTRDKTMAANAYIQTWLPTEYGWEEEKKKIVLRHFVHHILHERRTINSAYYCELLDKAKATCLHKKGGQPIRYIIHAFSYTAARTVTKLNEMHWTARNASLFSFNLKPWDFHLFRAQLAPCNQFPSLTLE